MFHREPLIIMCRGVLLTALSVAIFWPLQAIAQQEATATDNPRAFLASLSASERKLPQSILAQQRLKQGKNIPPGWEKSASVKSKSRDTGAAEHVYRLDGESLEALESVLSMIDAVAISRSASRSYVTAKLTDDQVVGASLYAAVHRIHYVRGPLAQGVTQAWQAHRVDGMDGAGEPDTVDGKPALTGEGVVIGIISNTIELSDLNALKDISNGATGADEVCVYPKSPSCYSFERLHERW